MATSHATIRQHYAASHTFTSRWLFSVFHCYIRSAVLTLTVTSTLRRITGRKNDPMHCRDLTFFHYKLPFQTIQRYIAMQDADLCECVNKVMPE